MKATESLINPGSDNQSLSMVVKARPFVNQSARIKNLLASGYTNMTPNHEKQY